MSDTFTFTVTNETDVNIVELWTSPDDEEWSQFDIGEGIPSGETMTIAWAEYTNDSPCEWWIQAVYDDDSESEPAIFDFCNNPDLVFS
jgi:hypothetical protein